MQRWLKLPDGRFLDANRIVLVGKVETFPILNDDGASDGAIGYAVNLGLDIPRERQLTVTGSKEEILALMKGLLGGGAAPA
ncbi:MAG: hypothetical protein ABJB01_12155 [Rudaea sp.]